MLPLIGPRAWAIDDVSVPKDERMSFAVAPQYCSRHSPPLPGGRARAASYGRASPPCVRPVGNAVERPIRAAASAERGWWDGVLPDCWLLVEWPAPTDYWLSSLPADTQITALVRPAKVRWRIEHDYRELKHGPGPDHFEGRSWPGWHHHVTLVTAAHAFLTEQRSAPKAPTPDSSSTRPSMPSRKS